MLKLSLILNESVFLSSHFSQPLRYKSHNHPRQKYSVFKTAEYMNYTRNRLNVQRTNILTPQLNTCHSQLRTHYCCNILHGLMLIIDIVIECWHAAVCCKYVQCMWPPVSDGSSAPLSLSCPLFFPTCSLHLTTFCLQHKPTVIACVCIHLACKWSNWEIPVSTDGKHWWEYVDSSVTLELLDGEFPKHDDILMLLTT